MKIAVDFFFFFFFFFSFFLFFFFFFFFLATGGNTTVQDKIIQRGETASTSRPERIERAAGGIELQPNPMEITYSGCQNPPL